MMNRSCASSPYDAGIASPYLLIGNELALFREVLSGVFQVLRPRVPVQTVTPADLDTAVTCLHPRLVICSAVSATIDEIAHAWILLRASPEHPSVVSVAGSQRTIPHPTLDELVELIDAIWEEALAAAPG